MLERSVWAGRTFALLLGGLSMPRVVLTYREARGKTPDVCMSCGAPATCRVEQKFRLFNPTGGVYIGAIGAIKAMIDVSKMLECPILTMRAPFCSAHQWHWQLRKYAAFGFLGMVPVVLAMAGVLMAVFGASSAVPGAFAFLTLVGLAAVLCVLVLTVIRMESHDEDDRTITLACVHRDFVTAVERHRLEQAGASTEEALVAELAEPEVPPTAIAAGPPSRRPAPPRRARGEEDEPRPRRRAQRSSKQDGTVIALAVGIPAALLVIFGLTLLVGSVGGSKPRQQAQAGNQGNEVPPLIPLFGGEPAAEVKRAFPAGPGVPNVPASAPLPEVLQNRESVDLIPLIDPGKDVVFGRWLLVNGALHCPEGNFVPRVQIPYLPPEEYDFVVTFLQPGLRNGVSLIMPKPQGGAFYWYVGNDNGDGYGFGAEPSRHNKLPGLIKPNTIYTTVVQVRKTGVRGFLDGKELVRIDTDFRNLMPNGWHNIHDARFLALAVDDPAVIYYARLVEVTGHGKKAR